MMAFAVKKSSWSSYHLNIVGCLLDKRLTEREGHVFPIIINHES